MKSLQFQYDREATFADYMSPPDSEQTPVSLLLSALHRGDAGVVVGVVDQNVGIGDEAQSTLAQRLLEIGFVQGEKFSVVGEAWPRGDPMAVRIGNAIFALRRREASAVRVVVNGKGGAAE